MFFADQWCQLHSYSFYQFHHHDDAGIFPDTDNDLLKPLAQLPLGSPLLFSGTRSRILATGESISPSLDWLRTADGYLSKRSSLRANSSVKLLQQFCIR